MRRLFLVSILALLWCAPSRAATPVQIQHRGCPSGAQTNAYASYVCPLPNPTQAGNYIICAGQYGVNASVTVSVSDDKSDTFTVDKTGTSGDANQTVWMAHVAATTGARVVTVTYSGASPNFVQYWCSEYDNLNGSVDQCTTADGTTATVTTGALNALTASNDLIVQLAENDGTGSITASGWVAGTGQSGRSLGALSQNDTGFGSQVNEGVQWGVYSTTTSFSPKMTQGSTTTQWNTVACAYKSSSSGNAAPASIYITSLEHYNLVTLATGGKLGAPLNGNMGVLTCVNSPSPGGHITAISGSVSGSWTQVGLQASSGGSGVLMIWYVANATLGAADVLTLTTSTSFTDGDCVIYGVSGAATAPLDTSFGTSGFATTTSNQTVAGNVTGVSGTPSTSNGLIIGLIGVNSGQIQSMTSGQSDTAYSPQEASSGELDENNGKGHDYKFDNLGFHVHLDD